MSTIDLTGMRGLGLDEALLQRLASELEKGGSTGGGGGLLGLTLSKVDVAKLANDFRDQANLKDIRSRVFFKILDEAAIAAGKSLRAGSFNLAAAVADLNQRLAGAELRAKKLEEIYWHLAATSNNREGFIARMEQALKSIAPEKLYMK